MIDSNFPTKKPYNHLLKDLKECLLIIKVNIDLYDNGFKTSYKTISAQLRLLLCDVFRNKNNSLLSKVFPEPKLHPVSFVPNFDEIKKKNSRIIFFMAGTVSTDSNRITEIFDINEKPIPLESWLNQNILDDTLTIKRLIRSVANKDGGAHVDSEYDDILKKTKMTQINDDSANSIYLIEISRYVLNEIAKWIVRVE